MVLGRFVQIRIAQTFPPYRWKAWTKRACHLHPNDERLWALLYTLRRGVSPEALSRKTGIDPWFTRAFQNIALMEEELLSSHLDTDMLWRAKRLGFSDEKIGELTDRTTTASTRPAAPVESTPRL